MQKTLILPRVVVGVCFSFSLVPDFAHTERRNLQLIFWISAKPRYDRRKLSFAWPLNEFEIKFGQFINLAALALYLYDRHVWTLT